MGTTAVLLADDLMFGSKAEAALRQAGYDVVTCLGPHAAADQLRGAALLLADLSSDAFDACALLEEWTAAGLLEGVTTVGYYQHVDDATRRHALDAGYGHVVPRSRLFREGSELLRGLA